MLHFSKVLQKTFPLLILKKLNILDVCEDCINLAQLPKTFLNPISSYSEFKIKGGGRSVEKEFVQRKNTGPLQLRP
jgi:hypothetical protein